MPTPSANAHDHLPSDEGTLREFWRVLMERRRQIVVVWVAVVIAVAVRSVLTPPVFQGVVKILIERENPKVLSFKDVAELDSTRDDYYQTQYKLLQSRSLARKTIEKLNLLQVPEFGGPRDPKVVERSYAARPGEDRDLESTVDLFLARLKIRPEKNTRLVNEVFESARPDGAAQIANVVAELYIEQTLDFRYQTSAEAGRWLGEQILEQRRKVEQAEVNLQQLSEREGIVNIEERRALLEQKLKELGTVATSLKTLRLQREVLYQQMRDAAGPDGLPEVMRNPVIQALRIELANLGRKEADLTERYRDQHPEVLRVRKQIAETRERLTAEARRIVLAAETEYRTALAQEASVTAALEAAKAEALDLSRRSLQYNSAKRELDAAKAVLDSVLSRAKETDVTQELKASNIRIVDRAVVPTRPDRPNLGTDLLLGMILGLGLGVGLALLLDHLDNTVKSPEDVRHHLAAPLLGVVPESSPSGALAKLLVLDGHPQGAFTEGYRVLRTALTYSWSERGSRVVMVTSTVPGEGKTLTAVNLALTLASAEANVLLVDCDLRKSQIHEAIRLPRVPGLSDLLVGNAELAACVHRVEGTPLSVLTSGTPVPSPADLLTGTATKQLIASLRERYDWIVVDTPPVAAVAEPLILAPLADGVVLVAGAEMASRGAIRESLHRLVVTGARVVGIVLNRARGERHAYYYGTYYDIKQPIERAHV